MAAPYKKIPDLHIVEIPVVIPLETRRKLEEVRGRFLETYKAIAANPSRKHEITPFLSRLSKQLHKQVDQVLDGTPVYVFDFTYHGNTLRYILGTIEWGHITNEKKWILSDAYPQLQIGFSYEDPSLKMRVYVNLLALSAPAFLEIPENKVYEEIFVGKQTWNGIMNQYV